MVWAIAAAMDVDYGEWVRLYQSEHWHDQFPEDNRRFKNVTYTPDVNRNREASLLSMRQTMFRDHEFIAAVFIGGMNGILDEYCLFSAIQPAARVVPVASTGGAAATLTPVCSDIEDELDYVRFFHDQLGVSPRERRYRTPDSQPSDVQARLGLP
jgi:hypothetical protein